MKYSIDTSALIQGRLDIFPPDIVPGFWEDMEELIKRGDLKATEEVLYEIKKKDDSTLEWVKNKRNLFVPIYEDIQLEVRGILNDYPKLIDTRKNRSSADPFVIALAKINSSIVITEERPTNSDKRPKIPDVCNALSIEWINLRELGRREGWKYHRM